MALGVRLKKSLNRDKPLGRGRSSKFESNGNDSYQGRSEREKRKSLCTEKIFATKGRYSDVKTFGREPINEKRRDFGRDVSGEETRSWGATCEMRSHRGKRDGRGSKKIPFRSEVIDQLRSRGKSMGHRGKRDGQGGEKIPFRSAVIDQLRSRRKNMGRKQRDANGNGYEVMTGCPEFREMRSGCGRKKDDSRSGRVYDRSKKTDESADSVEACSGKLRLKWKKMDKKRKNGDEDQAVPGRTGFRGEEAGNHGGKGKRMDKGDAEVELLKKSTKNEGGADQVVEQKPVRRQLRVLDKSGKKIRVGQKRSDDGSADKGAPVKKRKRVIKIDPYDISNKRLDDSLPLGGHADKSEEKDSEISKNAQFRAIQPSPLILSFVEDNLLGRRRLIELKHAGYNVKLSAPLDNIPFSTSTERERIEENVFRNKLEFFAAAKISSSFPPPEIPEIAFAGRSNVGKSSLLNALTRQWGVVRTSDKPGLTQTINFFKLASKLSLVDLPGYGFAYAKEEVKDAWEELVKEYVSTRVGLQRVCLLIDTKWGMKPRDHELIDLMERSRTPYQIVLTKTDIVFPIDVARRAMQIQENLKKNKSIINPVMMVSSKSGAGVRNLRGVLAKITRFVKP